MHPLPGCYHRNTKLSSFITSILIAIKGDANTFHSTDCYVSSFTMISSYPQGIWLSQGPRGDVIQIGSHPILWYVSSVTMISSYPSLRDQEEMLFKLGLIPLFDMFLHSQWFLHIHKGFYVSLTRRRCYPNGVTSTLSPWKHKQLFLPSWLGTLIPSWCNWPN